MPDYEFTDHAKEMLRERNIKHEWVRRTISTPERKFRGNDGNIHYTKPIEERDARVLRIVVVPQSFPIRIITLFFDRRLRKKD